MSKAYKSVEEMIREMHKEGMELFSTDDEMEEFIESLKPDRAEQQLTEAMVAFSNGEANKEQQLFLCGYFSQLIKQILAETN